MTEAGKQLQETATGHHFITRMRGDHDGTGTGGTRLWVLMTGMLSSCGALFHICAGSECSLRNNGFMGITSLLSLALSRADTVENQVRATREGG